MGRGRACFGTFNSSEWMLPKSRGRMVKRAHSFSSVARQQLILIGGKVQRGDGEDACTAVEDFRRDLFLCIPMWAVQLSLVTLRGLLICKLKPKCDLCKMVSSAWDGIAFLSGHVCTKHVQREILSCLVKIVCPDNLNLDSIRKWFDLILPETSKMAMKSKQI